MKSFTVSTKAREELIDVTSDIQKIVDGLKVAEGICTIFVPHTTAGVTINENADPTVKRDIIKGLDIIPAGGYAHSEGNSPAHIKSSIVGPSLNVFVKDGQLLLGTWQGICFAEFDGPRRRSVWVEVIKT